MRGEIIMSRERFYYKSDSYLVTSRIFKTKRRGYRMPAITQVSLRRTQFYLLLPVLSGVMSLVLFFGDLLYLHEIFSGGFVALVLGVASWSVGTIHLKGFNVDGIATVGLYWKMAELNEALNHVLWESEIQQKGVGNSGMSSRSDY